MVSFLVLTIGPLYTIFEEMEHGTYYKVIYKKCRANDEQIKRFSYLPTTA